MQQKTNDILSPTFYYRCSRSRESVSILRILHSVLVATIDGKIDAPVSLLPVVPLAIKWTALMLFFTVTDQRYTFRLSAGCGHWMRVWLPAPAIPAILRPVRGLCAPCLKRPFPAPSWQLRWCRGFRGWFAPAMPSRCGAYARGGVSRW